MTKPKVLGEMFLSLAMLKNIGICKQKKDDLFYFASSRLATSIPISTLVEEETTPIKQTSPLVFKQQFNFGELVNDVCALTPSQNYYASGDCSDGLPTNNIIEVFPL